MKNTCLLIWGLLWSLCLLAGGTEHYKFRTMSPAGGFYYDGVKDVAQDGNGFIWVMMDYELYRFDGYQYKKFYPLFAAMDPTSRWVFYEMATDSRGGLYVNTNNGLYHYDALTNRFQQVFQTVTQVKVDAHNRLWVKYQRKWSLLDVSSGQLQTPVYEGRKSGEEGSVFCLHQGDIYTQVHRQVFRFNDALHKFQLCFTLPGPGEGHIRFAYARQGKLWIVTGEGLYKVDLSTYKVESFSNPLPGYHAGFLRAFYVDKAGNCWLGTIDGVYVYHPESKEISHYKHVDNDPFSLPNNSVWTICEDRQSNIWISTYSGGLCYVNIQESNSFKSYQPQRSGLNYAPVSSFAEDKYALWIGTEGGGVNCMNKQTGEFTLLDESHAWLSHNIKSMVMDSQNRLWIATFLGGLYAYDTRTRRMSHYQHEPQNPHSLLVNDVRKIIQEGDSGLWVAYQHPIPQISYYSYRTSQFTHYRLGRTKHFNYLFDILRQGENTLWAISNEALYKMNIQNGQVEKIVPKESAYLGFFTFCLDDAGNIWIGTIGNGLVKFDTNTSEFIPMKHALQRDIYSVYSICYDDGNVWMGTDDGLYCYHTLDNGLVKFDEQEDTQGQVYYPLAAMKGDKGLLYLGGTSGFTVIQPKQLSLNMYQPKAIVSDFFIDHQMVHPRCQMQDSLAVITLDYDQENFGFRFSSDNYHIPEKNQFRYRLKGYANGWITTNAQQRQVMYSKVPAGTYYFEVFAANNDGVWNTRPTVIKIVRKPAPWLSWYAYLAYILMFTGVVYLVYRHFSEKKRLKMLLYQESLERDKKEQIHEAQLRFFTNISHDFRTPLSLILAALDKLRKEGLKEYYYRILNGNVQRLLNLVNELMDFRTIENGKMRLELEPLNLRTLVTDIAHDFTDYAAQRKMDFRIQCTDRLPQEIFADRNVVEKIVMNLLNNAFKYTADGGSICLEILYGQDVESHYATSYTIGECTGEVVSLVVRDTGVGISKESISTVFERFYKVNTVNAHSHLGTGIGLALVKSLVLLHKGSITIFSEREKGTDMKVSLPLNKALFDETDFKKDPVVMRQAVTAETEVTPDDEGRDAPGLVSMPSTKRKILIVEDNQDLRELIAESLSDDFDMFQAGDGLEALKCVEDTDFDLVISDIMMPHKDGVSLCADLKSDIQTSHIPVILLTAKTSLESKMEGTDSGADLYFEKPIDLTYLNLAIKNLFRNRQQLKEHYAKNYYADSNELATNEQDSKFLKSLVDYVEANMEQSDMDVNQIAKELLMSRSKLYTKVKSLTGKSVVEFVLNCRMRKAAKLIIEENLTMREVMLQIGIESQPYFTNSFKKVFGETPTSFANKHKNPGKGNSDKS